MCENKLKLSSPWQLFYKKINALFGEDPDIKVTFDEENNVIKMYVEGADKADALTQIVPTKKTFGNITVSIEVIPANKKTANIDLFRKAFEGNPAFSYAVTIGGLSSNDYNYVVFTPKVVQFFGDNMNDPHGNISTLYEDIASDVFEVNGIMYSTDAVN